MSRRPGLANWLIAGLITAFGLAMFAVAIATDRADSALLFIGLPVTLAVALALLPARTSYGRVFAGTTLALLLAAVALQEGAICVILAAPLVYAAAYAVTWIISGVRRRYALVLLPLFLLTSLEGTDDGLRVQPVQSVTLTRTVDLPVNEVAARIEAGPQPAPVRPLALRTLGVPVPEHVSGAGLDPGDQWRFGYHGTSHGPGGEIVAEVATSAPGTVTFDVVSDTAITARWFAWHEATITWEAVDRGHTAVHISSTVTRGLDPSWYFGPLQDRLMRQGLAHLLDMLRIQDAEWTSL